MPFAQVAGPQAVPEAAGWVPHVELVQVFVTHTLGGCGQSVGPLHWTHWPVVSQTAPPPWVHGVPGDLAGLEGTVPVQVGVVH
jgi:hypothetical protein